MEIRDVEEYVDRAAPVAGLVIAPEHRPGVIRNLAIALELGALIMEFPLDEVVEPVPVFRP